MNVMHGITSATRFQQVVKIPTEVSRADANRAFSTRVGLSTHARVVFLILKYFGGS